MPTSCAPGRAIPRRCCCSPRPTRCRTTVCRTIRTSSPSGCGTLERLAGQRRADAHATAGGGVGSRGHGSGARSATRFDDNHRVIKRGQVLPPAELAAQWLDLGYEPSPLVDQPGLFSRRGGILDVFPPGGQPLRIELWGDEVDTIRLFDPATQRSTEQLETATVGPAHEVLPRPLTVSLRSTALRPQFVDAVRARSATAARGQPGLSRHSSSIAAFSARRRCSTTCRRMALLVIDEPEAVARLAQDFEEQVEQLHADLLRARRGPAGPGAARTDPGGTCCASPAATRLEVRLDPGRRGSAVRARREVRRAPRAVPRACSSSIGTARRSSSASRRAA